MPHTSSASLVRRGLAIAAIASLAVAVPARAGQESKSGPLAKELVQLMTAGKIDSIAAPDPVAKDAFVAALFFDGAPLLVVAGKYAAPQMMTERIAKKDYREVYMDLQAASTAGSKVFVQDQNSDGLTMKADGPGDSLERNAKTMAFEGEKKAKMSEAEYLKTYTEADAEYARILSLLVAKVKAGAGS
jgi:hypothetical protein